MIDCFPRYIVARGVVKSVTRPEMQNLLALNCLSEGIDIEDPHPILQADLGSPNTANSSQRLIRDLEMALTPSPGVCAYR